MIINHPISSFERMAMPAGMEWMAFLYDFHGTYLVWSQATNPMQADYFNDILENKAVVVNPGQGETFTANGMSLTFKVTSELSNDQLGVYEIVLAPQTIGAKLHYHRFMDETFIVNASTLTVEAGSDVYSATPGTVIHVPRFTPHGFRNDSDQEVRLTLVFNPSQKREGFFRGLNETLNEKPIDPEKYLKLYNKYDSFPVDTSNMLPVKG